MHVYCVWVMGVLIISIFFTDAFFYNSYACSSNIFFEMCALSLNALVLKYFKIFASAEKYGGGKEIKKSDVFRCAPPQCNLYWGNPSHTQPLLFFTTKHSYIQANKTGILYTKNHWKAYILLHYILICLCIIVGNHLIWTIYKNHDDDDHDDEWSQKSF